MADPQSRTGVKWVWLLLMALLGAVLVMYLIVGFDDEPELAEGAGVTELSDIEEGDSDVEVLVDETGTVTE